MRKEDRYRAERALEFSRLTLNFQDILNEKQVKLAREGNFRDLFQYRLDTFPEYKIGYKAEVAPLFSECDLPPIRKLATSLVIPSADDTRPETFDLWIEPYRGDWKHSAAQHNFWAATGRNTLGRASYIVKDETGETHLITENITHSVANNQKVWVELMNRYGIQTIIGDFNFTELVDDFNVQKGSVVGRIIERDMLGEIRLADSKHRFYKMYNMTPDQIREFERRLSIAEALKIGLPYHRAAFEATGKVIKET